MPLIYNGVTVTAVTYNGVALTKLVYNGVEVWTSGYLLAMFYSGHIYNQSLQVTNRLQKVNESGAVVGATTTIGTSRQGAGGGTAGSTAVFYAGLTTAGESVWENLTNTVTRANSSGALVGSQTSIGTARSFPGGATAGALAIFAGGITGTYDYSATTTIYRINETGSQVGSTTNLTTSQSIMAGTSLNSIAMFYSGVLPGATPQVTNRLQKVNESGAVVGATTTIGTSRRGAGGGTAGSTAVFYAGRTYSGGSDWENPSNTVTRANSSGALVGSQTSIGTARSYPGGATAGALAIFAGGLVGAYANFATTPIYRINETGSQVGSTTNLTTGQSKTAGTSL